VCFFQAHPSAAHKYAAANNEEEPVPVEIEDSLQILQIPAHLQAQNYVTLRYICSKKKYVGVSVFAPVFEEWVEILRRKFLCNRNPVPKDLKIHLTLPDSILYKPGLFNREINFATAVKLKVWIVEYSLWPRVKHDPYKYSTEKKRGTIIVKPPYQRPDKLSLGCLSWRTEVLLMQPHHQVMRCQVQPGMYSMWDVDALLLGVSLSSKHYGIVWG
jgi:hypothetical protein